MNKKLNLNESFVCKIWEGGSDYYSGLKTSDGLPVKIIDIGARNYDSGPDYKNARIQIGEKTYAGDVEIHKDFKGWHEHSHKKDSAYNSVILQVVLWETADNEKPRLRKKRELPTVILSDHLNHSIHYIWQDIISKPSDKFRLQCYNFNTSISTDELSGFLKKLSIQRLNLKAQRLKERLGELSKNTASTSENLTKSSLWKQILFEYTFEALGYSKNKEAMLKLASGIDLKKAERFFDTDHLIEIQALLFGCSGLLFDVRVKDNYVNEIKTKWNEIKTQDHFSVMNKSEWKFFMLRPPNFPTLRIAYGSQLVRKILKNDLFKKIILSFKSSAFNIDGCYKDVAELFAPGDDEYWSDHYNFGKLSGSRGKLLGKERINDIIINVIIPLIYLYSEIFKETVIKANALKFYNEFRISPSNSILNIMSDQLLRAKKISISTPALEQAATQLYNFYCTRGRCNECAVGRSVENKKGFDYQIIFY